MITITRLRAQQLRGVLRRAFGQFRGTGPAVGFIAGAEGLTVRSMSADAAVEYRAPGVHPNETLWLPFQFLADCEGKRDEPVELATDKSRVIAQWRDGSVPQIVSYDAELPADADKFPVLPATFAENPPRLLRAIADAGECTDPGSVRFALGHIQLRGQLGSIGVSDGRQLLVQSGFVFPWEGDRLIPRNKVFASPELAGDEPVLVGQSGDWVAFRSGPWTIWLAVNKEGRFPDLSRQIPRAADATARCSLSSADVEFLTQTIRRLPSDETFNYPITVELNGSIVIRAKAAEQPRPTEVMLTSSTWSGTPVRLNMNRHFLARAVKLGFQELCIYNKNLPVLCQDEHRQYLWAVLDADSAIPPAEDSIRIESPLATTNSPNPNPNPKRRIPTVNALSTNPTGNGHTPTNGEACANGHATRTNGQPRKGTNRKANQQDFAALIEQAIKFRTALHDLMHQAGDLVKSLKQYRRQSKAVETTLASIKQLTTLRV